MVSDELVRKLQTILRDTYGQDVPLSQVSMLANDLVDIFDVLAQAKFREMRREKRD